MPRPQKHQQGRGRVTARYVPFTDEEGNELGQAMYPGSEYDSEELEVLRAVDRYRLEHHIRYPGVTDVLKVLKGMGYRRDVQ